MTTTLPTHTTDIEANEALGRLLARIARQEDTRLSAGRRARRTLQEMAPGYERQPVLLLHRPSMADDACPLCGRWSCQGSDCPPNGTAGARGTGRAQDVR
ncbi:hypothetical protein BJP40_05970 [Streptomyces sp. CC53]|uniref:hypothetical protein n=1 Tax=Streptomyces sp. CC53 TaxID=1906740 RepID=UPI0008DE6998|nr:hypothetical protein [Streptomyces sp. CC53]OII61318.1 hypothetical protein BJP40_05970 [Streptomyces sp. CC53]